MILMVGICFTTTSCTKEKSLKGTTWIGTQYTVRYTLSFYESNFTLEESDNEFYMGTYTYKDPVVTLYLDGEIITGTVTEDSILIIDGIVFTKR